MRNLIFGLTVTGAVVGGGLFGSSVDFDALKAGELKLSSPLALVRPRPPVAPLDPNAPRLEGLAFSLDASRNPLRSVDNEPPPFASASRNAGRCRMPAPSDAAQVILFGAYQADAVSTVALHDPDEGTGVVEVVIEPGDQPLYIVLTAYEPTIWRFSGAVERVERAVMVASNGPRPEPAQRAPGRNSRVSRAFDTSRSLPPPSESYAGVVGLQVSQAAMAEDTACFDYFYFPTSVKATRAAAALRHAAGRGPDRILGAYSLAAVKLPSGAAARGTGRPPVPEGFDPGLWRMAHRINGWGLSPVDVSTVVSPVSATVYDVLPGQTGLSQLVGSGALRRMPDGLRIEREIARVPAGLAGAHATQFTLAPGVSPPAGKLGHSCMVRESDGAVAGIGILCANGEYPLRDRPM